MTLYIQNYSIYNDNNDYHVSCLNACFAIHKI